MDVFFFSLFVLPPPLPPHPHLVLKIASAIVTENLGSTFFSLMASYKTYIQFVSLHSANPFLAHIMYYTVPQQNIHPNSLAIFCQCFCGIHHVLHIITTYIHPNRLMIFHQPFIQIQDVMHKIICKVYSVSYPFTKFLMT